MFTSPIANKTDADADTISLNCMDSDVPPPSTFVYSSVATQAETETMKPI